VREDKSEELDGAPTKKSSVVISAELGGRDDLGHVEEAGWRRDRNLGPSSEMTQTEAAVFNDECGSGSKRGLVVGVPGMQWNKSRRSTITSHSSARRVGEALGLGGVLLHLFLPRF
jgi:hypothetical protein